MSWYEKKEYEDRMRHKREVNRKKREEEMKEEVKRKVLKKHLLLSVKL